MKRLILILIYFCIQGAYGQSLKETADMHFGASEWKEAVRDYMKFLKEDNSDSSALYNLGYCMEVTGKYDEAIRYFQEAAKNGFPGNYVNFSLAKSYALKGDREGSLAVLELAAEKGLKAYIQLKNDTAFKNIRSDARFGRILEKVKLNVYPCLSRPENRQLDFWVGEWDVYANGRKVGESSITMANGGCAIHESYTTPGNYTGQSINFYNPLDHKWHQYWVASTGGVITFDESDQDDGMLQFTGTAIAPDGKVSLNRMTFSENGDGTVRQLIEVSNDNGKTWSTGFDGLYKARR